MDDPNGIYYFLGNITSHILHALPLYRELGGTFVVLSNRAKQNLERYEVPVVCIDDLPYQWKRFGWRIKPVHEYIEVDSRARKTADYLNKNAKVVIFYELFDISAGFELTKPKRIFLAHGAMLKDYFAMHPKRLESFKSYDYMAAMGPATKKRLLADGISENKLIDIGVARTDEIHQAKKDRIGIRNNVANELNISPSSNIVSYLPTFWGPSSIYTTGLEIIRNFSNDMVLLFRPHPQTPKKLLRKYLKIIKKKPNIFYAPEGKYNFGLVDTMAASSAIIGDVSSVMLEATLLNVPLIFAYDTSAHKQDPADYQSIREVVSHSEQVDLSSAINIANILKRSLARGIDKDIWQSIQTLNFYNSNGTSIKAIADFVKSSS